jgi:hypothetical protein
MQTAIATSLKGFLMTSASWKEVPESLCQEIPKIAEQLNQHINFHDFGAGVESLLFIAVMVPPTHDDHHNDSRYNARRKQIKIVYNLDYDFILSATVAEFKVYCIQTLVRMLKEIQRRHSIASFDTGAFADAIAACTPF